MSQRYFYLRFTQLTSCSLLLSLAFLPVGPAPAAAQLPGSDIWLAPLEVTPAGVGVGAGVNATARPGYDNQPCFRADGSFLYTRGDSVATDIWRLAAGGAPVRVTATPESEYSPTLLPAGDGFCVVRVEADGAQRLWRFSPDGRDAALVAAAVDSVGYFEWIDAHTLACFVLGEPHTLRIVDATTQAEVVVARDIGRFIRVVPGTRDVAFTLRGADDRHRFVRLPWGAGRPEPLVDGVGGEDAVWVGEWLLASAGDGVFAVRPAAGGGWTRVLDASGWGVHGVTRLAVSADRRTLTLVCGE